MTYANISRKAAQNVIKIARKYEYTEVKASAKQDILLTEIEAIVQAHEHMAKEVVVSIEDFPIVVKTKAERPTKTTKTIEADNSFLNLFKQAQQTIASLQAQIAKPQSDAESRLADALNELSETKEALAYAHQTITSKSFVTEAKPSEDYKQQLFRIADRFAQVELNNRTEQEKQHIVFMRDANEARHELAKVKAALEQSQFALAESRQEIVKLTNQLEQHIHPQVTQPKQERNISTQPKPKKSFDAHPAEFVKGLERTPDYSPMNKLASTQADKPRAITTIETLPTNCEIEGKPAYAMPGLASVFCLSLPELERMVRRLVTQGFAQLHIDTQQMIDKFTDDGIKYQLTDGSFFLTLR